MTIDYQHYDRVVSPLWNILIYNTREGLDELYGVEPWTYYVKNLLLNFNYIAPVGIFGPLLVGMMMCCIPTVREFVAVPYGMTTIVLLLPMYLWLGIVMPRPHKEERFLFPIYPCICLGAALSSVVFVQISLAVLRRILERKNENGTRNANRRSNQLIRVKYLLILLCILWIPSMIVSQTRLMALSSYYTAPLVVYSKISGILSTERSQADNDNVIICTCGEWYRFPSSFYLPNSSNFSFAPSSFDGQLPQPFTVYGSRPSSPTTFNDQNRPEPASLINDVSQCDFVVDISTSSDCLASSAKNDIGKQSKWDTLVKSPFLDAEQTSNVLHRTLFIPYLHEKAVERGDIKYVDYVLYKRVDKD
jgi:alpha-1,2-mannosyltransferase